MIEDEDLDFISADVFIMPPDDGQNSDEDSGDEDGGQPDNLCPSQLNSQAEFILHGLQSKLN